MTPAELLARETVTVPIETVHPYPGNAKQHDLGLIRKSLRDFGQYRPAVVQRSTGYVCVGNGMLAAAIAEGWLDLGVVYRDIDDVEARRLVLLDNRSQEVGGYDVEALAALLTAAPTLEGTGYDDGALVDLLASIAVPDFHPEPASEQPRLDRRNDVECPECHHVFQPK